MKIIPLIEKIKKHPKRSIIISSIVVIALIVILAVVFKGTGEITVNIETSLKEVLETSEISTVEYTYNSITEKKEDDIVKYYVKYKGVVKAGFDFDKLDVSKDTQDENKIIITIPEISINSVAVDEDLKYIFTKEKYDTEVIYPEAFRLCSEDLTSKAKTNGTLQKMAKESAEDLVKGLTAPFEEEGYIIEIVHTSDNQEVQ